MAYFLIFKPFFDEEIVNISGVQFIILTDSSTSSEKTIPIGLWKWSKNNTPTFTTINFIVLSFIFKFIIY